MPSVTFIYDNGQSVSVDADQDESVMRLAIRNGIDKIVGECGGNAMCATCHVYVDEDCLDRLHAMSEDEDVLLDGTAAERRSNSRLSCQIKVGAALDGLAVHLPDRQV